MEYERKQKIKKGVLIGYISITTIFTIFMIIMLAIAGVSSKKKQKASSYVQDSYYVSETYKGKAQPKYASYDDEHYKITLTADELNNYTWVNLTDNMVNSFEEDIPTLVYNDLTYSFEQSGNGFECYTSNGDYFIYFISDYSRFNLQYDENVEKNYIWYTSFSSGEISYPFEYSLTLNVTVNSYSNIKSAIELDIQANTTTINDGIFETLTDSIVAFIGSISAGINGMISVFWADDSITVIGTLSVIVVAVSLTYFLFRLIIGLIRMRG